MKLSEIYYNLTNSNGKAITFAAVAIAIAVTIALIPWIIYSSNSKYFGDAAGNYEWMPILTLCIAGAELVTVVAMIIKTMISK